MVGSDLRDARRRLDPASSRRPAAVVHRLDGVRRRRAEAFFRPPRPRCSPRSAPRIPADVGEQRLIAVSYRAAAVVGPGIGGAPRRGVQRARRLPRRRRRRSRSAPSRFLLHEPTRDATASATSFVGEIAEGWPCAACRACCGRRRRRRAPRLLDVARSPGERAARSCSTESAPSRLASRSAGSCSLASTGSPPTSCNAKNRVGRLVTVARADCWSPVSGDADPGVVGGIGSSRSTCTGSRAPARVRSRQASRVSSLTGCAASASARRSRGWPDRAAAIARRRCCWVRRSRAWSSRSRCCGCRASRIAGVRHVAGRAVRSRSDTCNGRDRPVGRARG